MKRRTVLKALGVTALPVPALAAADHHPIDPDLRVQLATAELKAALQQKYPEWDVQLNDRVIRPRRLVRGGPDEFLPAISHGILVFATNHNYGPEIGRWFIERCDDPMLGA